MRKVIVFIGLVILVATGIVLSYRGNAKPKSVETIRVKKGDIIDFIKATGRVEAVEEVIVYSKANARIEKVLKDEGDKVRIGEELVKFDLTESEDAVKRARLKVEEAEILILEAKSKMEASEHAHSDPSELELSLKAKETQYSQSLINKDLAERELNVSRELYKIQAESLLNLKVKDDNLKKIEAEALQAQRELNEAKELFSKREKTRINLTTLKTEYERATKQKALAEAELDLATSQLERLNVISSLSGTVVLKEVKDGMAVSAGMPLMNVADIERLQVRAEVDEVDAGRIKLGSEAEIIFEAFRDKRFHGYVKRIAPKSVIKVERTIVEVIISIDEITDFLKIVSSQNRNVLFLAK